MIAWNSATTHIHRVRLSATGLDPHTAEVRAAAQLRTAQLVPAGLSERAVLCVRTLRDPRPGSLALGDSDHSLPIEWQHALMDAVDAAARTAAHPARHPAASTAAAVLFADQAELLACLASDLCTGMAAERWWWHSLYRQQDLRQALLDAWLSAPGLMPTALEYLAQRGQVVRFTRSLDWATCNQLLLRLVEAFGLPAVGSVIRQLDTPNQPTNVRRKEAAHPHRTKTAATVAARSHASRDTAMNGQQAWGLAPIPPPWQRWAPDADTTALLPRQQAFVGIGLMLSRAPTAVRTSVFVHDFQLWTASTAASNRQASARHHSSPSPAASRTAMTSGQRWVPDSAASPTVASARVAPSRGADAPQQPPTGASGNTKVTPAEVTNLADPAVAAHSGAIVRHTASQSDPPSVRVALHAAPAQSELGAQPRVVETRLGGVFYLINLGLALGLYTDFTQPQSPGIALSIWDFLTLVARRLLSRRYSDDALWALLATLAGRARSRPGADVTPPGEWRMSPDWLTRVSGARAWAWADSGGRLRVRHPAGFLVLDVARTEDSPAEQLATEFSPYQPGRLHQVTSARPRSVQPSTWQHWLNWLMPYVRFQLRNALDIGREQHLGELLCAHSARITLTPTHLDVELRLEDLPIVVRMAGLDRDPGWVPAAGRYVAFHFN